MAISLITRNSSQRLVISNTQVGRKIQSSDIGNWNHIRIGCRINTTITTTDSPPPIVLGFCSGINNMYFSATTNNFIGLIIPNDASAWTNQTDYNSVNITAITCTKKENNIENSNVFTSTANSYASVWISQINTQCCLFADFKKNGNNLDVIFRHNTSPARAQMQITKENFDRAMNHPSPKAIFSDYCLGQINNFDEATYGYIDTATIGWLSPNYNLEIDDIAYSIFS